MHAKTQKDKRTKGQRNKYHSAHYKAVVSFVFLSFCVSIQIDYRGYASGINPPLSQGSWIPARTLPDQ